MAQPTAPNRAPQPAANVAPVIQIDSRVIQAGSGGRELSQASTALTGSSDSNSSQSHFSCILAPRSDLKVGTYWNDHSMQQRDALFGELLKPGGPELNTVKTILLALVSENKAAPGEQNPKLHLYMGFGEPRSTEGRAAARDKAFALTLSARALRGKFGDPECEQMVEWLRVNWAKFYAFYASSANS